MTGPAVAVPAPAATATRRSGFIVSPLYDAVFFILAPVLALAVVVPLAATPWATRWQPILGIAERPAILFILVWSHAHAVAVFFRSHGNRAIFVQHRVAFVAVPLMLFAGLMASDWIMVSGLVLAPFWAVYHIGMQNFGLARIYDARLGNEPTLGRHLDYGLLQLINLGPFLAGWSFVSTLDGLRLFGTVGWEAPGAWARTQPSLAAGLIATLVVAGALYLIGYVAAYRRLAQRGYRVSPQKIALLLTTAGVSIAAWGFLPAWQAVFVMNFFHGLQYFALVWHTEHANLGRRTRCDRLPAGGILLFAGFAAVTLLTALALQLYGRNYTVLRSVAALGLVVSLMHYWYDGFVWSVRKREV